MTEGFFHQTSDSSWLRDSNPMAIILGYNDQHLVQRKVAAAKGDNCMVGVVEGKLLGLLDHRAFTFEGASAAHSLRYKKQVRCDCRSKSTDSEERSDPGL